MLKSSWVWMMLAMVAAMGQSASAAITDDLVGLYEFQGNANDTSGSPNVNDGSAVGVVGYAPGMIGQAVDILANVGFDYVTLGQPSDYDFGDTAAGTDVDITLAFWMNQGSDTSDPAVLSNKDWGSGSNTGIVFSAKGSGDFDLNTKGDTGARVDLDDGPPQSISTGVNVWSHVATTIDRDGDMKLFINGDQVGSTLDSQGTISSQGSFAGDLPWNVGQDGTGNYGVLWDGLVDDLGIWRRALQPAEIQTVYQAGLAGVSIKDVATLALLSLTIDRDTGAATVRNDSPADVTITGYDIDSPTGAWDRAGWLSIAENYDADSDGSVDPDDAWLELGESGSHNLGEGSLGEATISVGQSIDLGETWVTYFDEDATFEYLAPDGRVTKAAIAFTGNGGEAWQFLDLNFDGAVDINDWLTFKTNISADLTGLSAAQGYALSDLDGDGTHDLDDFSTFQQGYDAANGAGAFDAMTAAVPEPSAMALAVLGLGGLMLAGRRRSGKNHGDKTRRLQVRHLNVWLLCGIVGGCLLLANSASAGVFLWEDFEGLPLGPNVEEAIAGDEVWTNVPPGGWVKDDTGVPGWDNPPDNNGVTEWIGWTFPDKDWWITAADFQNREFFTKGFGTVMVADPDEWDDATHPGGAPDNTYDAYIDTPPIDISGVGANELKLMFDSSWRPEFDSWYRQSGNITISYDGGAATEILRWVSDPASPDYHPDTINEWNETVLLTNLNNPEGATSAALTWGMFDAGNDWWWAVDNISLFTGTEEPIVASVNRANGEITLETGSRFVDVNGYEVTSESGSLNPSAWATTNLEAQGVDAVDGGDDPGETWEALSGDDQQLWEGFLLGSTLFSGTRTASLGRGYNAGVGGEDLEIRLSTIRGQVLTIPADAITYFGDPILNELGDVNLDGDVNGLDVDPFVGLVTSGTFQNEGDMNQDGVVNGLDVDPFVAAIVGGGVQAVPEPSTLALLGLAGLGLVLRFSRGGRLMNRSWYLSLLAAGLLMTPVGSSSWADSTNDRAYLFGDNTGIAAQNESATAGQKIGSGAGGVTFDTVSESNDPGSDIDAQNLSPSATAGPTYVSVGQGPFQRTGAAGDPNPPAIADLGAEFSGSGDYLRGARLGFPETAAGSLGNGLGNPNDYIGIANRGYQLWVHPASAAAAQTVVMDTNQHGVRVSGDGTWSMRYADTDFDSTAPVATDQWSHVMLVRPLADSGSRLYVNGVVVAAAAGGYDGDDNASLVLGANTGRDTDGSFSGGTDEFFSGVLDNLEMFVLGTTSTDPSTDYGTFDAFVDNEFIAAALDGYVDGDMNGDGLVNDTDLALFQEGWKYKGLTAVGSGAPIPDLETRLHGDFNLDGIVDLNDWHILRTLHTAGGGAVTAAVPEPSTALLAALAGLLCLAAARRRR